MYTTTIIAGALLSASTAFAHMEMQFPAPFKSKFNPYAGSDIDYTNTAPLLATGANYPCKGYQSVLGTSAGKPTASFAVGSSANVTITGGANHNGGSCQISLSTDSAKTFTVIKSIVGGCPAAGTSNLDFTIPSDAPAGDAILAWSWNNQVGNREFYMNCAAVTLTGSSSKAKKDVQPRAAVAFSSRPQIFVANLGNGCTVAEGKPVAYPNPGPDVTTQSTDTEAPGGTNCGAVVAGSSGTAASSSVASAVPVPATTASAAASSTTAGGVFITVTTKPASATTTSAAVIATTAPASSVVAASPAPSSTAGASTTSSPASTTGAYTAGEACTSEGEWNCISGNSFQRCASGIWSVVMQMAAGTKCSSGVSAALDMSASRRMVKGKRRSVVL